MPIRTARIRSLAMVAIAAAVTAAGTTPARAGTFDVRSCTLNPALNPPRPTGGADDAWVFETSESPLVHFEAVRNCPPADDSGHDGIVAQTKLNSGGPVVGRFAQWRFDAPTGTSLTHLRVWQSASKNTSDWELYTRTAEAKLAGSDCDLSPIAFECTVGFAGAPTDYSFPGTASLQIGLRCSFATTSCSTGATLHDAWSAMYATVVTVDDTTAPTASGMTGSLLAGGYIHGVVTAGVSSATDSTGIRALKVRVDGDREVARAPDRACDFTRRAPCPTLATPESFSFDSSIIPDGTHTAEIGVVDTGENFAAAGTRAVTVDNTAPFAPTPTSATSIVTPAAGARITWAEPGGQVAPITAAYVTTCGPAGCQTESQPAGGGSGSASVGLPASGAYTASVALQDAAGNFSPGTVATWTITRSAPTAPSPAPAPLPAPIPVLTPRSPRLVVAYPSVARDQRTLSVRGSVALGVSGKVTATVTARIHGRTRAVTRSATIHNQRFSVRVRLPSSAWRTSKVTVRYPGSATRRAATATRTVRQRAR
jgi:hypothetical protein